MFSNVNPNDQKNAYHICDASGLTMAIHYNNQDAWTLLIHAMHTSSISSDTVILYEAPMKVN